MNNAEKAQLLGDRIDTLAEADVDQVDKVQSLADAVSAVMAAAALTSGAASALTQAQLEKLSISGVTEDNLQAVRAAIVATADDGTAVDSLAKLQALVTAAVNDAASALSTLGAFAQNNAAGLANASAGTAPAFTVYAQAGVSGVTAGNVNAINDALASLAVDGAAVNSAAKVQAIVDAYNAVLSSANDVDASAGNNTPATTPAVSAAQLALIGAPIGLAATDAENLALLGDIIAGAQSSDVSTVAAISEMARIANAIQLTAANGAPNPALTAADLLKVGLTDVTTDNLPAVLAAIAAANNDGSDTASLSDVQTLVTSASQAAADALLLMSAYAQNNANGFAVATGTAPLMADFTAAGVVGVTASNLNATGASSGMFGRNVSAAGDINGDGLGDLIIGSFNTDGAYNIVLGGTQWVTSAVSGSGTLTGTAAAEAIIGSTSADTLTGGGGVDRFFAGMGNDTIVLTASDITNLSSNATGQTVKATVSGGGGFDTIRLSGGAGLNLSSISNTGAMGVKENSRIESVERIDLATDTAANKLTLAAKDVKDMAGFNLFRTGSASADGKTWTNVSGTALGASTAFHQLQVDGGNTDSLVLNTHAGVWTNAGTVSNGTSNYTVYQNTATATQVLVQAGVSVVSAPVLLASSNPGANGYLMAVGNNLTLTFDQAVLKGTGTIQLFNSATGALVEGFDVASSTLVTGWGTSTLTINPTSDLTASTGYHLKVTDNAVQNAVGSTFAGVADVTTLNFTTAAGDNSVAPTVYTGPASTYVGYSVSGAGDVNGDGYGDYILGSNATSGVAFVVYGDATGLGINLPNGTIATTKGFKISGGNSLGYSVSGIGDVNGDGLDDVIVGSSSTAGAAYVVYGNASGTGLTLDGSNNITNSSSGYKITGAANSYLGSFVSGAGDVNGDGLADLIVGATNQSAAGNAYVVYGKTGTGSTGLSLVNGTIAAADGFQIKGNATSGLGRSVSAAGDVNGDGLSDLIVTGADRIVYVVYGNSTGATVDLSAGTIAGKGFKITSDKGTSNFGNRASSAGDVNGDGLADVIVGSEYDNSAYVIYGNASGTDVAINSTAGIASGSGFRIVSAKLVNFGLWVSGAGDVNGDGLGDFIIGNDNNYVGAYVVYGNASGTTVNIDSNGSIAAASGFRISGPTSGLYSYRVSGAGDINGDGLADLLVGSNAAGYSLVLGGTQWQTAAVSGGGTVTGTASAEAVIGSSAADTLTGGGGVDRFFAGMGNDTIVLTASDVSNLANNTAGGPKAQVHGGGGFDTIRMSGGAALDLTTISNAGAMGQEENSRIESIERIDLATDTAANTLTLAASDVKDMAGFNLIRTGSVSADGNTWTNVTGIALRASMAYHQLVLDGSSNDAVVLSPDAGFWTNAGTVNNGTSNYTVYQNATTNSQVLVKSGVVVTNNDSVAPLVFDLNRDGEISYSSVTMDVNGDGHLDLTAWAGAQDGVLVWDKFADGLVHDNSQYAFAQYATTYANGFDARGKVPTDLSGLAEAFDTNLDGLLNAQDAQFAEFMVWQDANQNGVSDAGEVRSLADWGITEINLVSDGVQRTPAAGVIEAGRTTATATDGSRVLVSDAAFEYTTLHQQILQAYQVL